MIYSKIIIKLKSTPIPIPNNTVIGKIVGGGKVGKYRIKINWILLYMGIDVKLKLIRMIHMSNSLG